MPTAASELEWWKTGVFYQIYPRSFADANGDGIGDLPGITSRLDHLADLGVGGLWLSPFFRSPMADFGYDVADYCDVDPMFGTLADMDELLAAAHERGIKVLVDFVPNHTSDEHPWFVESRSSRTNAKRDWYMWADPAPDGGRPNNWRSYFRGPAWALDQTTGQYYLHQFLAEQPDLNWSNPDVRAAMADVLRFWLDRGVDGFRIDVAHTVFKDPQLRDNPVRRGRVQSKWNHDRPEVHEIHREWRSILDSYSSPGRERMAVGEVYLLDPVKMARYHGVANDELHLCFNFDFLWSPWRASALRRRIQAAENLLNPLGAWPNYTLSNHDVPRHATRFGPERARAAAVLLLTLRGTVFIYYGEEIGMENVADATGQDPVGRDPERTPMRWDGSLGGGFTSGTPWLPLGPEDIGLDVDAQRPDGSSMLNLYKRLIALRNATPALNRGSWSALHGPPGVLAYRRAAANDDIDVAINMGRRPAFVDLDGTVLAGTDPTRGGEHVRGRTRLAVDEAVVVRANR